jgi:hypothetical protein
VRPSQGVSAPPSRTQHPFFVLSMSKGQELKRVHGYNRGKERNTTNLLLMMQALVVILKYRLAFGCARVVFRRRVGDVACEDFLPEGEAAAWAYMVRW